MVLGVLAIRRKQKRRVIRGNEEVRRAVNQKNNYFSGMNKPGNEINKLKKKEKEYKMQKGKQMKCGKRGLHEFIGKINK